MQEADESRRAAEDAAAGQAAALAATRRRADTYREENRVRNTFDHHQPPTADRAVFLQGFTCLQCMGHRVCFKQSLRLPDELAVSAA